MGGDMAGTCDEASRPACCSLARQPTGLLLALRLSATAARMRSFKAASLTLSPSWMSMARLTFPSRLELNRPEGSSSAAPLANVILTTFLYVSPVQTMPPWDQTGVPLHFHSSRISGSASCTISRTFARVFPRQSPSSLIFSSINAEADSTGTGLFMYTSNSRAYSSCAQRNLQPPRRLLFRLPLGWYDVFMSRDTEALLGAFEHLPVEEKRAFTQEVLRRSLPFDSGPLED